mmetsp:Transcript_16861/g.28172  ORF Transcript_16861/g.28172 Transcript_16861/m.28172 type:complete len:162 (-) Transcript_16861:193-678(-)
MFSPAPMMDYPLIASSMALTVALFVGSFSWYLCGVACLVNIVTIILVYFRKKANLPVDKIQDFPIYDSNRLYSVVLVSIADFFTAPCIYLSWWLDSLFCWWVAATFLVVALFVLYDTMYECCNRVWDAKVKVNEGYVWRNRAWTKASPPESNAPQENKKEQ